ncbi:MAG: hypothetical protein QME94_10540 [Anaerolineae bacterium]|nr:hypothetical protein [Anaerolineae bacterium]
MSNRKAGRLYLLACFLGLGCPGCAGGVPVDVKPESTTWKSYCKCRVCSNVVNGICQGPYVDDGKPEPISQCYESPTYLLRNPSALANLINQMTARCNSWEGNDPGRGFIPEGAPAPAPPPVIRNCYLVDVTDPGIYPPEVPFAGSYLLAIQSQEACTERHTFSYDQPYADASSWSTRYNVSARQGYMDLWYNGQSARVSLTGSFRIHGVGCYDGLAALGITQCPAIVRTIELKSNDIANLGGDHVYSNINIVGVGELYGKVTNQGNEVAAGSVSAGDEALAQAWGMAGPGAGNGSLYFTANQVPVNNQRVGALGTWESGISLTAYYEERHYEMAGYFGLPEGNTGYIEIVGSTNNLLPVAYAGPDQSVCVENGVTLNGSFFDPDSDGVYHHVGWYTSSWQLLAWDNLAPHLQLPVGTHDLYLFVWDQDMGTAVDMVRIEVRGC